MKDLIKKYRKLILLSAGIWAVLLVLFLVNIAFSMSKVNHFVRQIKSKQYEFESKINWSNAEARELYKEKLWLENQVALAKTNSFSMGIDLKDSLVQVQLKGTILFQSKILKQRRPHFFDAPGKETYLNYFSGITAMDYSMFL